MCKSFKKIIVLGLCGLGIGFFLVMSNFLLQC